jgi:hypothetical protein
MSMVAAWAAWRAIYYRNKSKWAGLRAGSDLAEERRASKRALDLVNELATERDDWMQRALDREKVASQMLNLWLWQKRYSLALESAWRIERLQNRPYRRPDAWHACTCPEGRDPEGYCLAHYMIALGYS